MTADVEWSVVVTGDLGSTSDRHEINGLDERTARQRLAAWQKTRPDVRAELRWRFRPESAGEWRPAGDLRPAVGPNDVLPCGSPTAVRRHLAHGEACARCGTEGRTTPSPTLLEVVRERRREAEQRDVA